MGDVTKIEWAHSTFNPVVGCTRVSGACDFCYAADWAKRTGQADLWEGARRRTTAANWRNPRKWDREADAFFAEHGCRRRVFCASLSDVFDNQWDEQWRADLWELIRETPRLDWLLLTKRPQNIAKMLPPDWGGGYMNVWLGTTVENQEEANRRIPQLLKVPARMRFLSCEPLLGPVDLEYPEALFPNGPQMCCDGRECGCQGKPIDPPLIWRINWVIGGGESGPHARPSHPDWFRALRDQCAAAGVAYLHKQNGEYAPVEPDHDKAELVGFDPEVAEDDCAFDHSTAALMARIGKHAAGRTLDGVVHDGYPTHG